jgi:hypothetical protein
MSHMLEQAIVDAESLKEAARQSAEEKIVEHFSKDIKQAVNMILEQEEELAGMDDLLGLDQATEPAAPTINMEAPKNTKDNGKFVVDQLPYASTTPTDAFVSIDLDRLEESIRQQLEEDSIDPTYLEEEFVLDEEETLEEEVGAERTDASKNDKEEDDKVPVNEEKKLVQMIKDILLEESDEIFEEEDDDEILEEDAPDVNDGLEASPKPEHTSYGHETLEEEAESTDQMYEAYEAHENAQLQQESRSLKTKNKTLITEQKTLNKKARLLEEKLQKYGTVINKLKDKLIETNLANAKLLYQNRVLSSDSLNERQKDRIVETIMNAKTVEEAKIIYETLQSAVGANTLSRRPKSLNEVVTKRSSAFMPRKEEKRVDPFTVRMKALAGIKD